MAVRAIVAAACSLSPWLGIRLCNNGPRHEAADGSRWIGSAVSPTRGNASLAAVSPDGRYVVAHEERRRQAEPVGASDRDDERRADRAAAAVRYDGLTYAPDGDYVYYVTYELDRRGRHAVSAFPCSAARRRAARTSTAGSRSPRIVSGSHSCAGSDRRDQLRDGRQCRGSGERLATSLEPPDQIQLNAPSCSPDGKTILASACRCATVRPIRRSRSMRRLELPATSAANGHLCATWNGCPTAARS